MAERNLRGYRGLTLDAFGSLLDGGPSQVPAALRRIVEQDTQGLDPRSLRELWRHSIENYFREEPFLSFREVHRLAIRDIFGRLRISSLVNECVDEVLDAYGRAKVYPEVPSVLQEMERDVPVTIVSNMDTKLLLEALQNNGLAFTFVITSEEEQRYKPSASLFRRAIRYLGLPPAHILHIGDSYAEDAVGASSVGMGFALIQRPGSPEPPGEAHTVVHDLHEVRDLMRRSWAPED